MALLNPAKKELCRRLIAWERDRLKTTAAAGWDTSARSKQIDLADASIDMDVDLWDQDTKFIFMALLEVMRVPSPAKSFGVGPVPPVINRLSRAERQLYRELAAQLGVLHRLQEVAPVHWADVDLEGD